MKDKELDKLAADLGKYDKKGIYGQYNFEIWKGDINIPDWLDEEDKEGNRFEEMEARISTTINWLNKKIEKYAWVENSRRAGKDGNWIGIESKWDVVSEIKSGNFDEADAVHIKEIAEDTIDELKDIGNLVKKAGAKLVRILESDGFWSDRLPHMASLEENKMVDKIMMTERVAGRVQAGIKKWDSIFMNEVPPRLLKGQSLSYVPFHELDGQQQNNARRSYVHKSVGAKYDFIDEHYFYPVTRSGGIPRGRADRILAIPKKLIKDEGYMESLGYEVNERWATKNQYGPAPWSGMNANTILKHKGEIQ